MNTILGASGLGRKKAVEPPVAEEKKPLDPTGQPDQRTIPSAARVAALPIVPQMQAGPPTASEGSSERTQIERPAIGSGWSADRDVEPAKKRRRLKLRSEPQTIYFAEEDLERASDLAYWFKKSGRFKGLVKGHVGVSLVVRTALDLLDEEYQHDAAGAIDRGVRIASRQSA